MTDPDELFTLRNHFWVGNFDAAISEGSMLSGLSEALRIEKEAFVYRSYIGLGQQSVVIDEVREDASTPTALLAVKVLATYMNKTSTDIVLMTLNEWLNDPNSANNPTLRLIAGIIYTHEGRFSQALQILHENPNMEMKALMVHIFLKMDRIDMAEKQLATMQKTEDDSTLTQLATAWIYVAKDGQKCQEAIYLFQELADRFGMSVLLLNGIAVCEIQLKNFVEAEKRLIDAAGKNSDDPDTLINLIVVAQNLHKPADQIRKYISQLELAAPGHSWLEKYKLLESSFDRIATTYT